MPNRKTEFEELWAYRRCFSPSAYLQIHLVAIEDIIKRRAARIFHDVQAAYFYLVPRKNHRNILDN